MAPASKKQTAVSLPERAADSVHLLPLCIHYDGEADIRRRFTNLVTSEATAAATGGGTGTDGTVAMEVDSGAAGQDEKSSSSTASAKVDLSRAASPARKRVKVDALAAAATKDDGNAKNQITIESTLLTGTFRGREMFGSRLQNVEGYILEPHKTGESELEASPVGKGGPMQVKSRIRLGDWRVSSKFHSLTYWVTGRKPAESDPLPAMVDFVALTDALHEI